MPPVVHGNSAFFAFFAVYSDSVKGAPRFPVNFVRCNWFNTVTVPGADYSDQRIFWALQPQLFWNFRGTGAGGFWGTSTGIIARYRVVSEATNALDIIFKFAL